ncbi:MAG: site-specific integrase [Prevotella sp.]|nr:site-specific integrase [Prevotella sp.]
MLKLSIQFSFRLFNSNKKFINKSKSHEVTPNPDFLSKANEVITSLEGCRAKSTIDNYKTVLRSFSKFVEGDVATDSIDVHLIEGYQQWLTSQGVSQNSISCYMRSLRSLLHLIVPDTKRMTMFDTVFTGKTYTEKRAISIEEIAMLRQLTFPDKSPLQFSRDIFLFSLYALGMPFVDIAFLQKRQIRDGYIIYHRHKTGQRVRVRIEEPMRQIISKYDSDDSPFVFPILKDCSCMHDYESARSKYNRHLKVIGRMTGIRRPLTSYVARHSWASIAYHSNVDLAVISKALGHTSPQTTLTYIRQIDDFRIDQANEQMLKSFCF